MGTRTGEHEQQGSGRPKQKDLQKRQFAKGFLETAWRGWKLGTN